MEFTAKQKELIYKIKFFTGRDITKPEYHETQFTDNSATTIFQYTPSDMHLSIRFDVYPDHVTTTTRSAVIDQYKEKTLINGIPHDVSPGSIQDLKKGLKALWIATVLEAGRDLVYEGPVPQERTVQSPNPITALRFLKFAQDRSVLATKILSTWENREKRKDDYELMKTNILNNFEDRLFMEGDG